MRSIPAPAFPDDDGRVDAALASALSAYDAAPEAEQPEQHLLALSVLQDARVMVPVVALLGEVEYDEQGLAREKSSDMAAVLMTGRDGRTALLAFSCSASLAAWNPEARPVPVTARDAARAARQDGASALLLDVAGPVLFVVEGAELDALARGDRLVRLVPGGQSEWGWAGTGPDVT
jgi:hypothetical protein